MHRCIAVLLVLAGCDAVFGLRHVDGAPTDSGAADAAGYAALVVDDAPMIYLRLDETSGTVAHDLVDGGPNGMLVGNVTLGQMGALADGNSAMMFDGMDSAIDLGKVAQFPGTAPFSVEAWLVPRINSATFYEIVSRWKSPVGPRTAEGWNLYYRSESIQFSREAFGLDPDFVKSGAFELDTYHHVVATYDGTQLALYLDGRIEATASASIALTDVSLPSLVIGAGNGDSTTATMYGLIDEIAIYDHVLEPARVAAHFNARAIP